MRKWIVAVGVMAVACAAPAATFRLCAQNTLHLGYSSSNSTKVTKLQTEFATCDVTLLQEVMRRALDPAPLPAPDPPPPVPPLPNGALRQATPAPGTGYTWNVPYTDLLGATSYKESYSFIVKSTLTIYRDPSTNAWVFFPPATTANKFSRPPAGILLQLVNGTTDNSTWLIDYHAVFGKKQSDREYEVRAMQDVATFFATKTIGTSTYTRMVIGGDWNLDATNAAYNPMKTGTYGFTVLPNVKTSLTTTGDPSEPYDHFASSNSVTVSGQAVFPMTSTEMKDWRKTVSDHMGIFCTVTY